MWCDLLASLQCYHLTFSFLDMRIIPEKELCFLCEISLCPVFCVFAAFCTTGFDRHTLLVFNPANPETSIEDCLAAVGDRVARELDTHLAAAVNKLLTGSVCSSLTCLRDKSGCSKTYITRGNRVVRVSAALFRADYYFHTIFIQYEKTVCAHRLRVTI